MKTKCPYTFPHKSRKAMTEYLAEHEHYHPASSWNGGFVLAWNIKVHFSFDTMGGHDATRTPSRDAAWKKYLENHDVFWNCCEDAIRQYTDGEWANYPGIEQGEWSFGINGRSGGYLVLTEAPGWLPAPRAWKAFSMIWESSFAYKDWLSELDFPTLKRFYRAIRVLDHDLRREAIKSEMEYQYSFQREVWEDEQNAIERESAKAQESERPDLYGA
jgi:hypothetical protein